MKVRKLCNDRKFHEFIKEERKMTEAKLTRLKYLLNKCLDFFDKYSIYAIALVGIIITIFRCIDNNFWGDESYTILKVMQAESLKEVATVDLANPPFFFLMLKLVMLLLGETAFVYHFASALPLFIFVIFSLVCLKKEIGKDATTVFLTMVVLMPSALEYFVEVRMYSWAILFVCICFYNGYILVKKAGRSVVNWIFMCIGGVGAAYTHYFAFASIILIYFCVFCRLVMLDKKNIAKCIIATGISIIVYCPWLSVFVNAVSSISGDFWIQETEKLGTFIGYIFQNGILLIVYVTTTVLLIIGEVKDRKYSRTDESLIQIEGSKHVTISAAVWMNLTALYVVIVMWLFQLVYGKLVGPVFIIRYLYPTIVVFWLMLAINIEKLLKGKEKALAVLLLVLLILLAYAPKDIKNTKLYYEQNRSSKKTVELIEEYDKTEKLVIMTNIQHLNWTVLDYYFPNIKKDSADFEHSWLSETTDTAILILSSYVEHSEEFNQYIEKQGYKYTFIGVSNIASYPVYLYEVRKN